jgi:hypothetical protein
MLEGRRQNAEDRIQRTEGGLYRFLFFVLAMLIFAGCAAQIQRAVQVCPGKESVAEALSSLGMQLENAVPLKADGQCFLQYNDGSGKPRRENFPVKLWANPPVEICMQGDVAFDPKGVILGANKDEFWLAVRLKEISGYWSGRWSEGDYREKMMISPKLILEALGVASVGHEELWSLSKGGTFDVLTKREDGVETRKVYVNTCDYLVRRIEYFDEDGRAVIVVELDKYEEISKNFFVPKVVRIINRAGDNKGASVQITFDSVKPMGFTEKQRRRLFVRPQPQGFRHIYKIVDGKVIEQPK